MATLTQDQLNAIAKQSGYQGTFSNVGLSSSPSLPSPTVQPTQTSTQTPSQPSQYQNPNTNYFQQNQNTQPAPQTQTTPQVTPQSISQPQYQGNSIVDALNAGGQASDFASRAKLASTYGIQNYTGTADQNMQLLQKYRGGFEQAKQTKIESPKTMGGGSSMVNSFTGGVTQPTQPNPTDIFSQINLPYQQLLQQVQTDYQKYFNNESQRTSLVDEYKKLQKDSGLPELNAEAINMKNIIDGTEDDIRNEVTKAGGFATESQVLALSAARNKGLIKNYNKMVDTIKTINDQINTTMSFSAQDRQLAQQDLQTRMNFNNQVMQIVDKMQTNAQNAYRQVIDKVGFGGLYQATGGDPYTVGLVEKTLGLQPGGLAQLATYQAPLSETDKVELENKKLQNQKLRSEIGNGGMNPNKILTVDEAKSLGVPYGTTAGQAMKMGITPGEGQDLEKVITKIQQSPESKTINGVLPALSSLVEYKKAIEDTGGFEIMSGTSRGNLKGTYGNALSAWKSLAGLGALSGADFTLAENAVPEPGFFQRNSTMKSKIDASIKNATNQAEILTKRLVQNYPQAAQNLNTQLIDILKTANPNKNYVLSPDGMEVIELTQ